MIPTIISKNNFEMKIRGGKYYSPIRGWGKYDSQGIYTPINKSRHLRGKIIQILSE